MKISQRHLFGLSSIVSQSLPGIIIPAIMGIFGTTTHAQWKQQLPLNCSVVIISNLIYMVFISTEHASWEPARGTHRTSMDSILERQVSCFSNMFILYEPNTNGNCSGLGRLTLSSCWVSRESSGGRLSSRRSRRRRRQSLDTPKYPFSPVVHNV